MWELVCDLRSVCSPKHNYGLCLCLCVWMCVYVCETSKFTWLVSIKILVAHGDQMNIILQLSKKESCKKLNTVFLCLKPLCKLPLLSFQHMFWRKGISLWMWTGLVRGGKKLTPLGLLACCHGTFHSTFRRKLSVSMCYLLYYWAVAILEPF